MKTSFLLCVVLILALTLNTIRADKMDVLKNKFATLFSSSEAEIQADAALAELRNALCEFPNIINLSSLKGQVLDVVDPFNPDHYGYKFSFCQASPDAQCSAEQGALCQYDLTLGNEFVAALASWERAPKPSATFIQPDNKASGVSVRFTNGAQCHILGRTLDRVVDLRIKCPTKDDAGKKVTISETSSCNYEVDLYHKVACAGGSGGGDDEGLSAGAIFLLIIFVALAVYFIAGFAICMFRFGKRGADAIPHAAFWTSLPTWYIAGIMFTIGKIKHAGGSKTITTSAGEYEEA